MSYLCGVLGSMIVHSIGRGGSGGRRPRVNDKTGLTGQYNFTLQFACADCIVPTSIANSRPADTADTPGDAPTIFEAVEKQLGLKLVKAPDAPVEMVVIDRVEKTPTAN